MIGFAIVSTALREDVEQGRGGVNANTYNCAIIGFGSLYTPGARDRQTCQRDVLLVRIATPTLVGMNAMHIVGSCATCFEFLQNSNGVAQHCTWMCR
jgi:hypothetical protein